MKHGMEKQIVVYPHNGVLLSNKKEQTIDIGNMAKFENNHTECKKPHQKKSTYCMIPFI